MWRLRLTYQNFYSALDVRNIEIPGFDLTFRVAGEHRAVAVPAWRFGVAPLREITPEQKEKGDDYLRADPAADFVDDVPGVKYRDFVRHSQRPALYFGRLGSELAAVSSSTDACLFHCRSKLGSLSRHSNSAEALRVAMRDLHRAFDAAGGKSLLGPDLERFFHSRPEFARLQPTAERFFKASEKVFFGANSQPASADFNMAELLDFAKALAERERTR